MALSILLLCPVADAEVPVIESVTLSADTLTDGGEITVTVTALSNAPVDWINRRLSSPVANIYGGGGGRTFTEVSPGRWTYSWTDTISEFMPSGVYTYSRISVENEGQMESAEWPDVSFTVVNSNAAEVPIIESVTLSADTLTDGGEITVTVTALSNAPVDWINRRLSSPVANIYGGGGGRTFTEVSPGRWTYSWTDTISEFMPSGVYTYSRISVENEGQMESAEWPDVSFTVVNSNAAEVPIIESVTLSADTLTDGGEITVTVTALSNAPVDWINRRLSSPVANIYGGGGGRTFTEVSPGRWTYSWTDTISEFMPSGVYTYSRISVENEGQMESAEWPDITFTVVNSATMPDENLKIVRNVESGLVLITIESAPWLNYQLEATTDLENWTLASSVKIGTGEQIGFEVTPDTNPSKFYRVRRIARN